MTTTTHFTGTALHAAAVMALSAAAAHAQTSAATTLATPLSTVADTGDTYTAVMPTVDVVGTAESSVTKGYVGYDSAEVTRTQLTIRETPQTVDVLDIQKNKNYGTNDLSSILEGNAGIDATYDMRGESISIRGFSADANDIWRDGVRESGQVRRSTANIERVEILKGPASVLYGRSSGGGVINMVSKYANFTQRRTVGLGLGTWGVRNGTFDLNQVIHPNMAVRLTGEASRADSFRSTVGSEGQMLSPSITVRGSSVSWTGQFTHDTAERIPDRGPTKTIYDRMGVDYRQGFAHDGDFVRDTLRVWRSDLSWAINDAWDLRWQLAHRSAAQNFDHYYGGTWNARTRRLSQQYFWQETQNKTLSSSLTLNGRLHLLGLEHKLTAGLDWSREERSPVLKTCRGAAAAAAVCRQVIDPFAAPATWGRIDTARLTTTADNQHRARATGLFIHNLISLHPDLKLALGGRWDTYTFSSHNRLNGTRGQYSDSTFSPNAGIVWDITPAHTAYASWNRSFAPYGGRGMLSVATGVDNSVYDAAPQYNVQTEVGVKSEWLNRQLSTQLSAYQMERRNVRYQPDAVNEPTLWAVRGKDRSRGVEFSALGRLTPQWYLRASLGLMSAKVVQDLQHPQAVGRYLNNTSRRNGNVFVRYIFKPWYVEAGLTYQGKRYGYTNNGNIATGTLEILPGFTRVDAMVGYSQAPWNFTAAVQNVTNKTYWRSNAMPGSPRALTVKASYEF